MTVSECGNSWMELCTFNVEDRYLYSGNEAKSMFDKYIRKIKWVSTGNISYPIISDRNIQIPRTWDWVYDFHICVTIPDVKSVTHPIRWQKNLLHNLIQSVVLSSGNATLCELRSEYLDISAGFTQSDEYFKNIGNLDMLTNFSMTKDSAVLFMKLPLLPNIEDALPGMGDITVKFMLRPWTKLLLVEDPITGLRKISHLDLEILPIIEPKLYCSAATVSEDERKKMGGSMIIKNMNIIRYSLSDLDGPTKGFLFMVKKADNVELSKYEPIKGDISIKYGDKNGLKKKEDAIYYSKIEPTMQLMAHPAKNGNYYMFSNCPDMFSTQPHGSVNHSSNIDKLHIIPENLGQGEELIVMALEHNIFSFGPSLNPAIRKNIAEKVVGK